LLAGGHRAHLGGELEDGYYVEPTVFRGHNRMRIFQEEIFGPIVSVTTFKTEEDALAIANDTLTASARDFGLATSIAAIVSDAESRRRVWINCYHAYPAHAAFGGYKQSGIGRETHSMMLDHYQQTKNLLVSYSPRSSASSRTGSPQTDLRTSSENPGCSSVMLGAPSFSRFLRKGWDTTNPVVLSYRFRELQVPILGPGIART